MQKVAEIDVGETNNLAQVTHIDSASVRLVGIPAAADGLVESLLYDVRNNAILISTVDGATNKLHEIEEFGGQDHFHYIGEFVLEDETDQQFTFVTAFDAAQEEMTKPARYLSALYESSILQYDIRENLISPRSAGFPRGSFDSTYLVGANFEGLLITSLYIDRHKLMSGGKDTVFSPAVVFMGEFEKVVRNGETLEVELMVDDLDTQLTQVAVAALSSDPDLLATDLNILDNSRCTSMCLEILSPRRKILRLTPKAGKYGATRITVTASDDVHTTKTSFILYIPPEDCSVYTAADVLHDGCGYRSRKYDPVPARCGAFDLLAGTAGETFSFKLRTEDQFGHPVHNHDIAVNFNATVVLGDKIVSTIVEYSGADGIYLAESFSPILISGSFYVRVEATFVIRTVHTRYDGLQIPGSPYEMIIRPAALDFSNCLITGMGLKIAKQGAVRGGGAPLVGQGEDAKFEGNLVQIISRDRFLNVRTATGEDHFGMSFSTTNLTAAVVPSLRNDGVYSIRYWIPDAIYNQTMKICATGDMDKFKGNGCDGETEVTEIFDVYVLPFEFWYYNGPHIFDAVSSYIYVPKGCGACLNNLWCPISDEDAVDPANNNDDFRRTWVGVQDTIEGCEMAIAGTPYNFYVQTRDEFLRDLYDELDRPANHIFKTFTYIFGELVTGTSSYIGNGVYKTTITLTRAHEPQPVYSAARDLPVQNSPFFVQITPGRLNSRKSFAYGPATVMAMEGTKNTLEDGNVLQIEARDAYDNVRLILSDQFALDPNTQSAFQAEVVADGNGTYTARFWWEVEFVQTYDICIRDTPQSINGPTGDYKNCVFRCQPAENGKPGCKQVRETLVDGDGVETNVDVCACCEGEDSYWTDDGDDLWTAADCNDGEYTRDDRAIQQVTVFIRANEGSPFTSPSHATSVCMNNIFDDSACYMKTGKAGVISSFTIEAKNEIDLPNYRGADYYLVTLEGNEGMRENNIGVVRSTYLRIQFYEIVYTPTVSGTYTMNIFICNDEIVEEPPDFPPGTDTSGNDVWYPPDAGCKVEVCAQSPYTVVVEPGDPYPGRSTYEFPPTFSVGDINDVIIHTRDYYENPVQMDPDHVLHIFAHQDFTHIVEEFAPIPANDTSGKFLSEAYLRVSGMYNISVEIWIRDTDTGTYNHEHVVNSPAEVMLRPAEFSIFHTAIEGFNAEGDTFIEAANDQELKIHAKDRFLNDVIMEGLDIVTAFQPSGIVARIFEDLGAGAYEVPFNALLAGPYDLYLAARPAGAPSSTQASSCRGSPFSLIVDPGPPARVVTSGTGLTGGVAGVYTNYRAVVQDQFLNVRTKMDELVTTLALQDGVEEDSNLVVNITVMSYIEFGGINPADQPSTARLLYQGEQGGTGENGVYLGRYMAYRAGVYRPAFQVGSIELTGDLYPFSISYGAAYQPRVQGYIIEGEGVNKRPTGVAGATIRFEVQLLDQYENPRLTNDAEVNIVYMKFGAQGLEEFQPPSNLIEYKSGGVYEISILMQEAILFYVFVRSTNPFPQPPEGEGDGSWVPDHIARDDEYYKGGRLTYYVRAGATVASRCVTYPDSIVVAGSQPSFTITIQDQFDNRNFQESELVFVVTGEGVATFDGVTTWDTQQLLFVTTYLPIKAGLYNLRIELQRVDNGEVLLEPVGNQQVRVTPGEVSAETTMASGLGVIRVTPFPCDAENPCGDEDDPASLLGFSEFTLQAKDVHGNAVTEPVLGDVNGATIGQISVEILHETTEVPLGCELEVQGHPNDPPNGNNYISYRTPWDDVTTRQTFCNGQAVDYGEIRYKIQVMLGGIPILGSPYVLRVGVYIPPSHRPYLQGNVDDEYSVLESVTNDKGVTYETLSITLAAGDMMNAFFQNVYRDGLPGCQLTECEIRADDNSQAQIEDVNVGKAAVFVFLLEFAGAEEKLETDWEWHIANDDPSQWGRYDVQYTVREVGPYHLSVLTGGEAIDGCPMLVTVVPNIADASNTVLDGLGLLSSNVDEQTSFTVVIRDEHDNIRDNGDAVTMEWDGATSGNLVPATFDSGTRKFTLAYSVTTFLGMARFFVKVNTVSTTETAKRVPCTAGPIAALSYPLSRDGSGSVASPAPLVAGQRETIIFQGADSHGNLRSQGGNVCAISSACSVKGWMTVESIDTEKAVIDRGDGTYRLTYDVFVASDHLIAIKVNDIDIINSPFLTTVVPASLNPAHCIGTVPEEAIVGETKEAFVEQRDLYDNAIADLPPGIFVVTLEGQGFPAFALNPLRIEFFSLISGNKGIFLSYRCGPNDIASEGVVTPVNYGDEFPILFRPEVADISKTRVAEGLLKVKDCIATQEASFVLQTRDVYGNPCDRDTTTAAMTAIMIACEPPDDAQCLSPTGTEGAREQADYQFFYIDNGRFKVTYSTSLTGYYQMVLLYGDDILTVPQTIITRQPESFVILSDTAAVPNLCTAVGLGLETIIAGTEAIFEISAMGLGEGGVAINRRGSGDEFEIAILSGAEICPLELIEPASNEDGSPVSTYTTGGKYTINYVAKSNEHVDLTWPVVISARLVDESGIMQHIAGSPFTMQMIPAATDSRYSFAEGTGITEATAGITAELQVTGRDRFNNAVSECVIPEFEDTFIQISEIDQEGSRVDITPLSCSNAIYTLQYYTETAGPDYIMKIKYHFVQILGSPHSVVISSALMSGSASFMSAEPACPASTHGGNVHTRIDQQCSSHTGELPVATAGESTTLYLHMYDRYYNRLSQKPCEDAPSCLLMRAAWCQQSRDLMMMTDEVLIECPSPQNLGPALTWLADSEHQDSDGWAITGVYSAVFTITRSGTYSLLPIAIESSGDHVHFHMDHGHASHIGFAVEPAAAAATHSIAAPSDVAIALETISFALVARDEFDNNVDTTDLHFELGENKRIKFRDDEVPTDSDTGALLLQEDTAIAFSGATNAYVCRYKINAQRPSFILLQVYLDGVPIWDAPFPVTVRSAQNVPAKCYAITNSTGTSEMRTLDLSRDLYNLDSKTAGETLQLIIQSIGKTGPRRGYGISAGRALCTLFQIENDDIENCDLLDEFNVVAVTSQNHPTPGQRVPGEFKSFCLQTPCPEGANCDKPDGQDGPWDPNDCARDGIYQLEWTTELSGQYVLSILSFGVLIQTGVYVPGSPPEEEEVMSWPPHDFYTSLPIDVYVNPAPMDAYHSEVYLTPLLALYEYTDVLVIGRDRYGNYVDRDGGQATQLVAKVIPQCNQVVSEFRNFDYVKDVAACTGTCTGRFRGSIRSRFAGPAIAEVYFISRADVLEPDGSSLNGVERLVHNEQTPVIVGLGFRAPGPNTGHEVGGTELHVPVYGICDWDATVWTPVFTCIYSDIGIGGAAVSVPAQQVSNIYEHQVHISLTSDSGSEDIAWQLYHTPVGETVSNPVPIKVGANYPSKPDGSIVVSETWTLPRGSFKLVALNYSWHGAHLEITDGLDLDEPLLRVDVFTLGPQNRSFEFSRPYDALHGIVCGATPPITNAVLKQLTRNEVAMSIGTVYQTVDARYQEFDSSRVYKSINEQPYFYYKHAIVDSIVPKSGTLYNSTVDIWEPHQFVYVTAGGEARVRVRGSGFNNGNGADKHLYLCAFFNRNCTFYLTIADADAAEPLDSNMALRSGSGACQTEPLFSKMLLDNSLDPRHPSENIWTTVATYVSDSEVTCKVPVFDEDYTPDLRVEISINSQDARPSTEESIITEATPIVQYAWIRIFDLQSVEPSVSALAGDIPVIITLDNPDPTMDGHCRFGDHANPDGTLGLPLVPAIRLTDTTLECIVPVVDRLDVKDINGDDVFFTNEMIQLAITFDSGETFTNELPFFYYSQPDVTMLFPPVGPTSGGTQVRLELRAGERYDDEEYNLKAFDYSFGHDQFSPKCLFKNQAGKFRGNGWVERPGVFEVQQREYVNDQFSRTGSYLSQQIICTAPSNPTPGAAFYVDVSLDGITYAYENGGKVQDPQQFGYYADVAIITMDANDNYNAQVSFRTAISKGDASVTVRFAYSCGYAEQYAIMVRCLFGNDTSSAITSSLNFGADITNSIDCRVPTNADPSVTTIQLALNGVDFTVITTQTAFTYYGTPVSLGAAYVTSVWRNDRQNQYTTQASEYTDVQIVVCEIVDNLGSYVSQNAEFGSLLVHFRVERTFGAVTDSVYNATNTLGTGFTSFAKDECQGDSDANGDPCVGITLYKPRAGGSYKLRMEIEPSPEGNQLMGTFLEMVIVVGPTDIGNSIIALVPKPQYDINPGSPFYVRVQARDSADNKRIEGADVFRIRSFLVNSTEPTAVAFFNPSAVSNVVRDLADGSYDCESNVIASSQRDDQNNEIRIWGEYMIEVVGINASGLPVFIKGSPVFGARITPVDCTMSGLLYGSSPNTAGDLCICDAGYQKAEDQKAKGGSMQHMVCEPCAIAMYKEVPGNDVSCEKCPPTTWTVNVASVAFDDCVCEPGMYDFNMLDANCISQNWFATPPIASNDACFACPACLECFGNNSIKIIDGYWSENEKPFVAYACNSATKGSCQGGTDLTDDDLCATGSVGPTCANCDTNFKKGTLGCEICTSWIGLAGINWQELILFVALAGSALWICLKALDMANPEDIIKGKILIAFGQVLTSFAATYNIQWPDHLKKFIAQFNIINFNIFEIGSLECEFPGIKNFYTRFLGTVSMPVGLITLIYLMWKSKMKATKVMRKSDYEKSMLEVKIEDIEITGQYASRGFFVLIFLYLKVSQVRRALVYRITVLVGTKSIPLLVFSPSRSLLIYSVWFVCVQTTLDMFKCRRFKPSDDFIKVNPAAVMGGMTDRSYLEADLRLPCGNNSTYVFFAMLGYAFVLIYPVGIPAFFAVLMFRERDQIHDAVNKKKYGFLFKDYAMAFFFWEIWDLIRKILLSGILIFFNRGSVGQIVLAMCIALFALELQLRIMPYESHTANWIQVLSFNCILLTLMGALLLKVEMVQGVDSNLGIYFANVFLIGCNAAVPLICVFLTVYELGYEFWMTSAGQKTKNFMISSQRRALSVAIKKADANAEQAKSTIAMGDLKKRLIFFFWKKEDVEGYLLAEELDMVRERREQRDQARILLQEAKITLSEKREWLRFIKRNAQTEEEFVEFMENESIDTYKKLILGQEIVEDKQDVWGDFAGDELNQAYSNPIFANRYKKSTAFTTNQEMQKQIRAEYKIIK
jgi:hypothetical protein